MFIYFEYKTSADAINQQYIHRIGTNSVNDRGNQSKQRHKFCSLLFDLPHNGYRVFPGGKVRPKREADPSPPSSAEVKNRIELYH